ncbi:hypothetical protein X907_1985 [Glycocaulis alkaliphilus]|uniref:Uncharacterized protein n=1 Tax=Glycocaulis alkaliphilus TaxID=1434191 RepID=A0A3T0EBX0_9PROT|nr:hypothetical protein [Glycocaulis alkaliphilus]AZU04508.1 hypothetical protein X907_1985 [Glycocaulis alkaliphilus]GGB78933.1 hypothetical protein GCM10007417_18580 [Glycocaulis alkaliphilus]
MLRLLGAILIAGFAVLAAAFGAAWLLDARATEGGRELALSLAIRDADTAARPLEDCSLRLPEWMIVNSMRGWSYARAVVDGDDTSCWLPVVWSDAFSKLYSPETGNACRFDLEYAGDYTLAHDNSGCATTYLFLPGFREELGSCLGLSPDHPRVNVELRRDWPERPEYRRPVRPSTFSILTGCPDPKS